MSDICVNDLVYGKEQFTVCFFGEHISMCSFSSGFELWMWDLIVLLPDHCLSLHLEQDFKCLDSLLHLPPFFRKGTSCLHPWVTKPT